MGYLFDRATRISADTGAETPVAHNRAVYVLEDAAREAAASIFSEMDSEQLVRFLFLPFPEMCMEWRFEDEQICVLLEESQASNSKTGELFDSVTIAILVENSKGRQWQASMYYVRAVNSRGAIPWDESPAGKTIKAERRMSHEAMTNLIAEIITQVALINAPNLRVAEPRDMAKLNKARAKAGKPLLTKHTIIRPTPETREWVRSQKAVDRAEAREHWVRGHFHTYWTGPKSDQQKPIIKLLAPHKRGNPERGTKEQRYVVT